MTESEAIKELKEDIALYDNEITRLDASIGTPDRNLIDALDMAIHVLEKQVPMKVKNSGERIPFEWYCPACRELLCDDGYKDTYIKYCEHCGQKLDWS